MVEPSEQVEEGSETVADFFLYFLFWTFFIFFFLLF